MKRFVFSKSKPPKQTMPFFDEIFVKYPSKFKTKIQKLSIYPKTRHERVYSYPLPSPLHHAYRWQFLAYTRGIFVFIEFRRVANQYFLLCVFLQFIPGVTPFHISFSIMPLVFILGVTALKDAVEDYVSPFLCFVFFSFNLFFEWLKIQELKKQFFYGAPKRFKIGITLNNFLIVQKMKFEWKLCYKHVFFFDTHQLEKFNESFFAVGRKKWAQFQLQNHFCTIKKLFKVLAIFWPFRDTITKQISLCFFVFLSGFWRIGWKNTYIMQSCLPTTIYVQNLSFLTTQISTSQNFFSIWPIYMIFMGDIDKVCNFLTPPKKG